MGRFPFACLLLALLVTPSVCLFGKEKKEAEREKKEAQRETKNAMSYQKLKDYAITRYKENADFREEVDQAFEDLQREHSIRAYEKNIGRKSYMQTVNEDNWRVHVNLYDNLLVQDHINRIGQRVAPEKSEKLFAFKVTPDPVPSAEALATGTVYVSTGLISLLDSEAQLAYVLAHEMAHVHLDHWKERVMMEKAQEAMADERAKKVARIALISTIVSAAGGAAVGGVSGDAGRGALTGMAAGAIGGTIAGLAVNRPLIVNWEVAEEDLADEFALKQVLNANYDVRQVPELYVAMERAVVRDARVSLGFLGSRRRIEKRLAKCRDLLNNVMKADIDSRLKQGMLGDSAEHRNLMAELKRDNGIMAYYHDMYQMARTNLTEAVAIRENDAAAHYFLGKVLKLVGRSEEDRKLAMTSLAKANQYDERRQNYGSYLHHALAEMQSRTFDKKEIITDLDKYVSNYARWTAEHYQLRLFPPNLDSIFEYMRLYGDPGWRPKAPDLKDLPTFNDYFSKVAVPIGEGPSPFAGERAPGTAAKPAPESLREKAGDVIQALPGGPGSTTGVVKQLAAPVTKKKK